MNWQLIETAPKDGTGILLLIPALRRKVWIGWFIDDQTVEYGKVVRHRQEWMIDGGYFHVGPGEREPLAPSHWMPLPSENLINSTDKG